MTLFILTETSAGYVVLKAKDKKLLKRNDLASEAETVEGICSLYVDPIYWTHLDRRHCLTYPFEGSN